jgi:acetyl-CoA carboxylase biotin carboxyl carrier protein
MAFTFKDVAEILKIIDASQCEEVVIEVEGLRLVVRRGNPHGTASAAAPRSFSAPANGATAASAAQASSAAHAPAAFRSRAELSVAEGRIGVRAPMVGSFYRRPSPQDSPFVEVGQRIKAGDPLCLIEVMKLYTTISAPAGGIVEAIAVEDAAAVEFDQLLFVIKPDSA